MVDKGDFDYEASGKFPGLTTPDESYHGLVYTKAFGNLAFTAKARAHVMRDFGMMISPMNAWLTNMNLETLPLRMQKHSENGMKLAEYLASHPKVEWVEYPGLPGSPDANSRKIPESLRRRYDVRPERRKEGGGKTAQLARARRLVIHVADARTGVLHPASTTHRQLSDGEQRATGILPELIRVSAGLEHIDDIIADFEQALSKI